MHQPAVIAAGASERPTGMRGYDSAAVTGAKVLPASDTAASAGARSPADSAGAKRALFVQRVKAMLVAIGLSFARLQLSTAREASRPEQAPHPVVGLAGPLPQHGWTVSKVERAYRQHYPGSSDSWWEEFGAAALHQALRFDCG